MNRNLMQLLLLSLMISLTSPALAVLPVGKDGLPSLAPLMKQITPAVVNIAVRSRVADNTNPLLRDPFFRRFFNIPERALPARPRMSAGSGVIVDAKQGYVLTNNHVIENAAEIMVKLKDRREFEAKLIGRDPGTDIALLKIQPDNLTALTFGNSDLLEVGDFAVAIGNPFGLGQTVTSGIISALGRTGLNLEGYEDFIQTDASINPGNSGGALVNLKGELIGINTAIIGPSGGNVGIGFAVPSNMARAVMEQLKGFGEVRRGQLGVVIQDLTLDLAAALGANTSQGAVITQVGAGTPAEQAGLQAGDVIISVNGRPVGSSADLRNRIGLVRIGNDVELELLRGGQQKRLRVRVGENTSTMISGHKLLPQLAGAQFKNRPRGEGVSVAEVEPGSLAARYGLREDDIVIAVNRQAVRSVDDLKNIIGAGQRVVAMNVRRGYVDLFIVIQ